MSGGSRLSRREVVLVAVMVSVLFAGALMASLAERAGGVAVLLGRSSTFGTGPGGLKGLYLLLARSGFAVQRWRSPLAGSVLPDGTLCIMSPRSELTRLERDALLGWVERGNALLLVAGDVGTPGAALAGALGFGLRRTPAYELMIAAREQDTDGAEVSMPGKPDGEARALLGSLQSDEDRPAPVVLEPAPDAGLDGVGGVPLDAAVRLEVPPDAVVLIGDPQGAVLAERSLGAGRVAVLAGQHPLSNRGLGAGDAAVLADRLLRRAVAGALPGPVMFDEYHHGFSQGTGLLALLAGHPAGLALSELLLAVFLFLAARGRAFGRARRSAEAPRREAAEQVRAFARLFRRGRGSGLALEILRRDARAAIASRLSVSGRAGDDALARRAAGQLSMPEADVRAALAPTAGEVAGEGRAFIARARRLARIAERMRHGRRDGTHR